MVTFFVLVCVSQEIYWKEKYKLIFAYVQLHFILNIIAASFFETENFKNVIQHQQSIKNDCLGTSTLFIAKFSAIKTSKLQPFLC